MSETTDTSSLATDNDSCAYECAAHRRWKEPRRMLTHFYGGTKSMHEHSMLYLPKHPAELSPEYWQRVYSSELFPAVARTVDGVNGIMWRKPVRLAGMEEGEEKANIDPRLLAMVEDADGRGNSLHTFFQLWSRMGWLQGMAGVLCDYPTTIGADGLPFIKNAKDEKDFNIRPFFVGYLADDVLNFKFAMRGAQMVLVLLVLRERTVEPKEFGEVPVTFYRVYRRSETDVVTVETYRAEGNGAPKSEGVPMMVLGQDAIPFFMFRHGNALGPMEVQPPFLDLCYTSLGHYRVQSDRRYSLKLTLNPILVLVNLSAAQKIVIGPNAAIRVPEGGNVFYAEPSGAALGEARTELMDLEAKMASMGLAMLSREQRQAETATAKKLDRSEQMATISAVAHEYKNGIEELFLFAANYLGLADGPEVEMECDFSDIGIDPSLVTAVIGLVNDGHLSVETLWDVLVKAGVLGEAFKPEEEMERLAKGIMLKAKADLPLDDPEQPTPPAPAPAKKPVKPGDAANMPDDEEEDS